MSGNIVPWWKRKRIPVGKEELPISALQRQMNRVFNEFTSGGSSFLPDFFSEPLEKLGERWTSFVPNVNVAKTDTALIVTVEAPGMDEKDIELSLTKDGLAIRGERRQSHEHIGESGWNYVESAYGSFERIVPLADLEIEEDRVEATASKGIVTITLPIKASAQSTAKKVNIRST